MKKILSVTLLLVFAAAAVQAQTDFSKVQMKATKVAGNVYMLEGAGGNIGVSVGDDGILIVDDQYAPIADKIRAALKGIADKKQIDDELKGQINAALKDFSQQFAARKAA